MGSIEKVVYYPVKGHDDEKGKPFVRCGLHYSKGGHNCISGQPEKRGYYISVAPVKRDGFLETYVLFTAGKWLTLECARRSPKRDAEALKMFDETHQNLARKFFKGKPDYDIDFANPEVKERK